MLLSGGVWRPGEGVRSSGNGRPCAACWPVAALPAQFHPIPPHQLGLSPPLTSLDPDAAALLLEAYESDKAWRSRGPARVTPPPPLRAGRLVVELCDAVRGWSCGW